MRRIAMLACLILSPSYGQTVKDSDLANSIVQIDVHIGSQFITQGTAFVVRRNDAEALVASAFHVYAAGLKMISGARAGSLEIRRFSRNGGMVSAPIEIAGSNPDADLIVLRVGNSDIWDGIGGLVPLTLFDGEEITISIPARSVGYFGSELYPIYLSCEVSGTTTQTVGAARGDVEEFLVSGLFMPGHSGSPILDDAGTVLGVVSSIVPGKLPFNSSQSTHSGLVRVVKVEQLKSLLGSIGSK